MNLYILTEEVTRDVVAKEVYWDNWGTITDYSLSGAYIKKPELLKPGHQMEQYKLSIDAESTVYALVLRYSEIDSFGSNSGKGELIWTYTSKSIAEKAMLAFQEQVSAHKQKRPIKVKIPIELDNKEVILKELQNPASNGGDQFDRIDVIEVPIIQ
ncbi:hypothetical protein J8A87_28255 [Vibrio parahaemolyticus]|uniref:hypothetical protein n=1 Tax=Vibrio sp. Vb0587 TaxID=3074626 RepID=UPI002964D88F|nr:hypothetical protein [Vibrio sp. Vb0587]MBE4779193.1 hypothetical protein [Vibrio parahaemolyticus]MCF9168319.1 hypothetical protein [Vibrio parahaemolyticus]MDW1968153.1 hypothetical protein [Vibrio sp. Vb0587]